MFPFEILDKVVELLILRLICKESETKTRERFLYHLISRYPTKEEIIDYAKKNPHKFINIVKETDLLVSHWLFGTNYKKYYTYTHFGGDKITDIEQIKYGEIINEIYHISVFTLKSIIKDRKYIKALLLTSKVLINKLIQDYMLQLVGELRISNGDGSILIELNLHHMGYDNVPNNNIDYLCDIIVAEFI